VLLLSALPAGAGAAPAYRPIRRLDVPANGGAFGFGLATVGSQLLVGAPNLGTAGSTDAHAYVFDPATSALVHDLVVPVGHESWWQFSVGAVGANPFVGIAPGAEEDGLDPTVTIFDGATGAPIRALCCYSGIASGVGTRLAIAAMNGGGIFDPVTGTIVAALALPDPDQRDALSMLTIDTRTVALAAAHPVGVHLFDVPSGKRIGFVGTRHGDTRHFGSAMAVHGSTLAVTEIPQVNVFDVGFGLFLGTINPPAGLGGASFGAALAYTADGYLAVGAPSGGDVGAVHLFDASGNLATTLPADGAGPTFGRALAGLGRSIAVGVPTDDGGSVVIYAPCGDHVVDAPVEQCDDGESGSATCDDECRFVTAGDDCGDADGDGRRGVSDGVQILRAAASLASDCTLARCDVDGSGIVSITDAVQVLRAAAGLPFTGHCASRTASE
jgi:hypothetical protein